MDKMTFEDYHSLYWLAMKEALHSAKILKSCKKDSNEWRIWLDYTKKDSALAIKARKLSREHIAD